MRFILSLSLFCLSSALLVGCTGKPSPMPRGYASYDQHYKSAPGPKPHNIGYAYTNDDNSTALKDMRYAAQDLVEKLDKKLSFNVDEIYLRVPENTAFYNSFDHLIRDELTQRGYLLSNTPVNAVRVDFVALDKVPECFASDSSGAYQNVYLALAINSVKGVPQDSFGDFYEVPLYDFHSASDVEIEMPQCVVVSEEG
tara:strand:+ start:356 stop:949 length:594 start_codon:yes stop_codon:yes gene_type:complete